MSEIRTDTINNASGDNDSGIDLSTNDKVVIKTANTTAVTVDASQNVGIATSSPSAKLHIDAGASTEALRVEGSGAYISYTNTANTQSLGFIQGNDTSLSIAAQGSGNTSSVNFISGGSESMRISSGNLLVGTTSATGSIQKGVAIHFTAAVGAGLELKGSNTTGTFSAAIFRDGNGTDCGSIDVNATANTTAYTTSSDHRLKENVTADWDATTRLKQLNPVRFNFIADADTTVDGFLAHEVQSVVPEAITGTHNEVDDDGNPVYQGIDQSKLVPLLVKTIQELEARITALENA